MALDLSNDYTRGAVALVAVFLPPFALIKAYKVARYSECRTTTGYWLAGLLLVGTFLFYAFVLEYGGRIILGGIGLLMLAMMMVLDFFNNRRDS